MNLFFIIYDWALSGVNTFVDNLIIEMENYIDIEIHILYIPQFNYKTEYKIDVPTHLKKYVQIFDIAPSLSLNDRLNIAKDYISKYKNSIVIPNYYYEFYELAYDENINLLAIIHSDDLIYYAQIEKYNRYLSYVVSVSHTIKSNINTNYPYLNNKNCVINYGINLDNFNNNIKQNKKKHLDIIYAGRLEQEQKRVLDLIEIVKELNNKDIKYTLHIIGDGSYRQKLQKELNENVIFYGRKTSDEMVKIYKNMDIILLTSEYEGLPLVLLEAMSMGVVPIVSNFKSGIDELLNNSNSRVVNIGDIQSFVNNIETLFLDENLLFKLKINCQSTIQKKYSSKIMAENYYKRFKTILSNKKNINHNFICNYKEAQKLSFLDDYIQREDMILKFAKNIAIYGNGKSGQMIMNYLKKLNINPKYIVDDSMNLENSITYEKFLSLQNELDILVMGKYQNIYHDLTKLTIPYLKLEMIR
jgi:glycosyltransferase involved in cell wall biosynthesis